jgi:hypothetical protein
MYLAHDMNRVIVFLSFVPTKSLEVRDLNRYRVPSGIILPTDLPAKVGERMLCLKPSRPVLERNVGEGLASIRLERPILSRKIQFGNVLFQYRLASQFSHFAHLPFSRY